jgi:hypothetical protein
MFPPVRKMDSVGMVSAKLATGAESSIAIRAARKESRSHDLGFMSAPLLAAPGMQANAIQATSDAGTRAGDRMATTRFFRAAPVKIGRMPRAANGSRRRKEAGTSRNLADGMRRPISPPPSVVGYG